MNKMFPYEVVNRLKNGENNAIISRLSSEIEELKAKFADTDYKTIKNKQYEAMELDLPYPWDEVYKEAESIRVQIREKERQIENLLKLNLEEGENNG